MGDLLAVITGGLRVAAGWTADLRAVATAGLRLTPTTPDIPVTPQSATLSGKIRTALVQAAKVEVVEVNQSPTILSSE